MASKKFTAIIGALAIAAGMEIFVYRYHQVSLILPAILLAIIFIMWLLTVEPVFSRTFALYLIQPLLLFVFSTSFIMISDVSAVRQSIIALVTILLWLYFENVRLFNFEFAKYNENALENLSSYTNIIMFFFFSICLSAAAPLIGAPFWMLVFVLSLVVIIMTIHSFWVANLDMNRLLPYLIGMVLVTVEVFWVTAFLPTNFYVHGFILAITYYIFWGVLKSSLLGIFSRKILTRYLVITFFSLALVIFTAPWI